MNYGMTRVSNCFETVGTADSAGVGVTSALPFSALVEIYATSCNAGALRQVQNHEKESLARSGISEKSVPTPCFGKLKTWMNVPQWMFVGAFDSLVGMFVLDRRDRMANEIDWEREE